MQGCKLEPGLYITKDHQIVKGTRRRSLFGRVVGQEIFSSVVN